jgi:hypothetical protein
MRAARRPEVESVRTVIESWLWTGGIAMSTFVCGNAVAGGHFDVDDAGTLDPGQCQFEMWKTRGSKISPAVIHVGPACRVGAVEFGGNFDQLSGTDQRQHVLGPQVKWTFWGDSQSSVSMAFSGSVFSDEMRDAKAGGQLVMPITWRPAALLQVHVNVGMDWATGTRVRTNRYGLGGEWAANEHLSLIAERSQATGAWTSRVGIRFNVTPLVSVDLSTAHTSPGAVRSYVIGLNGQFSR